MKRQGQNKNNVKVVPNFESKCETCIWYLGNKECAAFKDKIPQNVWEGIHDKVLKEQEQPLIYEEEGKIL